VDFQFPLSRRGLDRADARPWYGVQYTIIYSVRSTTIYVVRSTDDIHVTIET
jgi:hypothetical protein